MNGLIPITNSSKLIFENSKQKRYVKIRRYSKFISCSLILKTFLVKLLVKFSRQEFTKRLSAYQTRVP